MKKLEKKEAQPIICQTASRGRRAIVGCRLAPGPRPLVASRLWPSDCWSEPVYHRLASDQWSPTNNWTATAGRQLEVACWPCADALNSSPSKNFFYLLPSFFCTYGQILLVGSSTCMPCPNFS
jgi:hypothetical protein